ncbi:MAG: HD-GYP domain-containing protein [Candidatus Sumerlaeota bacterium]
MTEMQSQERRQIPVGRLRPGMFVMLPVSWMDHPFLKNQFLLKSQDEIRRIAKAGIQSVLVDPERSRVALEEKHEASKEKADVPENWNPLKGISAEMQAAIGDPNLEPKKRARTVYEHSLNLMNQLLEKPTAENIRESKQAIGGMVDMVLNDDETAFSLLRISDHDFYTYTHSVNVGIYSISLAKELYRDDKSHDMQELGAGFFLHDLGKVRVEPEIINKPGRLTDEEIAKMRRHPYQSYKILKETSTLTEECGVIAMQHHERHDGTGYPRKLKADEIHDYGRICCIADVFDALTAERSYKKALPRFQALQLMRDEMLDHFEPEMFERFVRLFAEKAPRSA